MSEQAQQVVYAVVLPFALSLGTVSVLWLVARRNRLQRLAVWAVPLVASACVLASYYAQMRDRSGRWQWVVPALAAVPLAWATLLMVRRPRLVVTLVAAVVLAGVAGGLAAATVYPSQPSAYRLVVPAAVFGLTLVLYPLASRATAADAMIVSIAGLATAVVVVLGQFLGAAELLAPGCVAAGVAGVGSLFLRKPRTRAARRGLLGGAVGVGLLLPVAGLVGWLNSYDLQTPLAWAFVLPAAGLPLLWLGRLTIARHRPWLGVLLVATALIPSAVGLLLALANTDLRPFGITDGQTPGESSPW